ncbi:MAG: diacylglycerol kinase family protein [Fulvivirga sp.]|uniref:diacylglycerol/lipid kinase family protein n=1 Tax=Fulvivirga sp. TaxID=1931237 RepID=UPI0032EF9853
MRKILFVINPIAGDTDKANLKNDIIEILDSFDISFYETTGDDDENNLNNEIKKVVPEIAVACGGDGTVNLVVKCILGKDIQLGIIPLGSANGLATELEIPEDIEASLKLFKEPKARQVDVLKVNDEHLCIHLSDIGLNAQLIRRFESDDSRGMTSYFKHFFQTLFTKKAIHYSFDFENDFFQYKAEMVVFANAKKYGTGAIVNPIGELGDKKFEVCIFKPYPWYAFFRLTFLFFVGRLNYSPFVKIVSTQKIIVKGEQPEHLQIDGEPIGKFKEVKVEILPDQILVIC